MGLNLYEVQQKIERLLENQTDMYNNAYDCFYNPEKKDVILKQMDIKGEKKEIKVPNYSKILSLSSPIGSIVLWGGNDVPEGWMECSGITVKRNDYLELFTIAKKGGEQPAEPFGTGDAVNTFGLPNFSIQAFAGTKYIIRVK